MDAQIEYQVFDFSTKVVKNKVLVFSVGFVQTWWRMLKGPGLKSSGLYMSWLDKTSF